MKLLRAAGFANTKLILLCPTGNTHNRQGLHQFHSLKRSVMHVDKPIQDFPTRA